MGGSGPARRKREDQCVRVGGTAVQALCEKTHWKLPGTLSAFARAVGEKESRKRRDCKLAGGGQMRPDLAQSAEECGPAARGA